MIVARLIVVAVDQLGLRVRASLSLRGVEGRLGVVGRLGSLHGGVGGDWCLGGSHEAWLVGGGEGGAELGQRGV